ncbi:DUF1963 domain-containing protein [Planctopirus hydrillae]|nr:DUF1963 domain-containing protein [Planctopirus hydrillae]
MTMRIPLSREMLKQLNAGIEAFQLEAAADKIREHSSACYSLIADGQDKYKAVGNTRFGGEPDLPANIEWPTVTDQDGIKHCNFICQINFSELPPLTRKSGLPSSGILYLFIRFMGSAAQAVLLHSIYLKKVPADLKRRKAPKKPIWCDEYFIDLVATRIRAEATISIQCADQSLNEYIRANTPEINDETGDFRLDYLNRSFRLPNRIASLLGYSNPYDPRDNLEQTVAMTHIGNREAQWVTGYKTMKEFDEYARFLKDRRPQDLPDHEVKRDHLKWLLAHREEVATEQMLWHLLLKLHSNDHMKLNINDADPLYVYIRENDFTLKSFDNLAGEITQG